jgi:RimJ/RimL family protein N-acetyltransferase
VREADASLIADLRNDPELGRFLNPGARNEEEQAQWLHEYFQRPDDYYFAICPLAHSAAEGFVALYDVDRTTLTAEWGRWILARGSLAAIESCYLVYKLGFETLGLREIFCRTLAANKRVVGFHTSVGLHTRDSGRQAEVRGEKHQVIEQVLPRERWHAVEPRLRSLAARLAGGPNAVRAH